MNAVHLVRCPFCGTTRQARFAPPAAPRVLAQAWVLAYPLGDGLDGRRFDFYHGDDQNDLPLRTPFMRAAQRFPSARAAYDFADQHRELRGSYAWIVVAVR